MTANAVAMAIAMAMAMAILCFAIHLKVEQFCRALKRKRIL